MTSFPRILTLNAPEADRHPDVFERVRSGELHGFVVQEVYSPGELAGVVERLERHDPPFLQTWFPPEFRAWFYGMNLNLTEPPQLPGYFQAASQFHEQLAQLFPPSRGILDHVASVLSKLDHGRPFLPPPGPRLGQSYLFTTIRAHLEGGFIPPHSDNEQATCPSYAHLETLIQPPKLSFVLTLTRPDGGGALELYDFKPERPGQRPDFTRVPSARIRIPPGSLIVLDSGRYLHRVTKVEGPRKRWTVCSFLARSKSGNEIYFWG